MVVVDDLSLIECSRKIENNTKQGAIEFLRCIQTYGIIVYWSDKWGKLIARSKSGQKGSWKGVMGYVMDVLEVKSRKDWEELKRKHNL